MQRTSRTWTLPLVALAALGLLAPAGAQQDTDSDALFVDRVDVNVINVEVFVTDGDGNHVAGLEREDFEIFEDGRPVEISNFYAISREDRVLRDLGSDRAQLLAGTERGAETELRPLPQDQQLNLVVYVDHFNLRPHNRNRVLDDLEGFLEDRIAQGDNVMLVSYDRSVDVVEPFTDDRGRISAAIDDMRKKSTHRQRDDAERRRLMRFVLRDFTAPTPGPDGQVAAGDALNNAYQYIRSYVQSARNDLRYSAAALRSVVRSLSGLPGRKALLYVSDGLPQRPGEELYQHLVDLYGTNTQNVGSSFIDPSIESLREDESHLFNTITREANANQVTLYTLDARGPDSGFSLSPENPTLTAGDGGRLSTDSLLQLNYQEPLIDMAVATGGTTILNTFNFDDTLVTMAEDFDTFYSLGYRSPRGGDGEYHDIDVRVKRPGLKVRHRSGYVDKPEVERVADRTLSSLLLDLEKNPLDVSLDFGAPEKKGRDKYLLPILVRIPFDQVTFLPNGDQQEGRLRIFLVVQGEEGGISELHEFPYPVSVPQDKLAEAQGQEIGYQTTLEIRGGTPKVAIAVWDELSGTDSYVHKRVLVGKDKKSKKDDRRVGR